MSFALPSDTYFDLQWHLLNNGQTGGRVGVDLDVFPVWEYYRGSGVRVGVFDDGTYVQHPDLVENWDVNLQPIIDGGASDPNPLTNPFRDTAPSGHGTAVAGLIVAPINGIGVVGVAPEARFGAALVVLSEEGLAKEGAYEFIDNQERQSYDYFNLYDVVNHSYGSKLFVESWQATRSAREQFLDSISLGREGLGVIHVVSAGNARDEGDYTCANAATNLRQVVVAAAGSDLGDIIYYSTPGVGVLVTAPTDVNEILGPQYPQWERNLITPERILEKSTTTDIPGELNGFSALGENGLQAGLPPDYSYTSLMNGTSAAAPMISGVVSLMLEANPRLGYRDVQEILAISSKSPWQVGEYELYPWQTNGASYYNGGGFRYSPDYGFGFVDAAAAVRLSETWQEQRTSANEIALQASESAVVLQQVIPATIAEKLEFEWNVDAEMTVEWIELQADIEHSWWGDLDMKLISPSGTSHALLNRIGVTPGFVSPLFPDTASVNLYGLEGVGNLDQPFASTMSRGESSVGTWKLEINGRSQREGGMGGVGTLESVQLSLFGRPSPGLTDSAGLTYYYTDRYAELLELEPGRLSRLEGDIGSNVALNFSASSEAVVVSLFDAQAQIGDLWIPIADSSEIETVFGGAAGDRMTASLTSTNLYGGWGPDQIFGRTGWDYLDGGAGDDFIRAGIGRDTVSGGSGADELHGDFGWNTFKSEKDGFSDLLVIKSDEWLVNPLSRKSGNNPNGERADIIEGLDSDDRIQIIGVFTPEITVRSGATAHDLSGIGIYAKGALEAIYIGGDLSVDQISAMTRGDEFPV